MVRGRKKPIIVWFTEKIQRDRLFEQTMIRSDCYDLEKINKKQ